MPISSIRRDWGVSPAIVRITTDSTLAEITAEGYLEIPAVIESIRAIQNGDFQWVEGDLVAITYADGEGFFLYSAALQAFVPSSNQVLMQHARIEITAAQLLASYATPLELIAAPGEDKKIWVKQAALHINYGGTVFANGGAIALQLNDTANGAGVLQTEALAAADLISQTDDGSVYMEGLQDWADDADTVNEGLYLSNLTGAFTGGTGSTFELDVWYSVVSYA